MSAIVNLGSSAFLFMDFQPLNIGSLGSEGDPIVASAVDLLSYARANAANIAHVRVALTPADFETVPDRNITFSALKGRGLLADGTPDADFHPQLTPAAGEEVFRKHRVSPFVVPEFGAWLQKNDLDTLVLAGVATSGVILSTVRAAADLDFRLIVVTDCCGDGDADVHRTLVERVFPRQALVARSADIVSSS